MREIWRKWKAITRLLLMGVKAMARSVAVLRSWEQLTRTAGLGAIGLSLLASGESVNPWSMGLGTIFLALNAYLAYIIGEKTGES